MLRKFHKLKNKPALSRWLFYLITAAALISLGKTPTPFAEEGNAFLRALKNGDSHPFLLGKNHLITGLLSQLSLEHTAKILTLLSVLAGALGAELRCRQKGIASINALIILPLLFSGILFYGNYAATLAVGISIIGFVVLDYRVHTFIRVLIATSVGLILFFIFPPMLLGYTALVTIDFIIVRTPEKRWAVLGSSLPMLAFLSLDNVELPPIQPGFHLFAFNEVVVMPFSRIKAFWYVILLILLATELSRAKRWSYSGRSFAVAALFFLLPALLFFDGSMRNNLWFYLVFILVGMLLISEIRKVWQRILILLFVLTWTTSLFSTAQQSIQNKSINTERAAMEFKPQYIALQQ